MKSKLINVTFPALMMFAVMIVNILVYYSSVCTNETVQSRDIYGVSYSADVSSMRIRQRMLEGLSGNYDKDIHKLSEYSDKLSNYEIAAKYVLEGNIGVLAQWENLSGEQRKDKAQLLYNECLNEFTSDRDRLLKMISDEIDACNDIIEYLKYIDGYDEYILDIASRSELLTDISIYKDDNGIIGNIVNTHKDFYGLENISLTPVVSDGFMTFLNYRITDFLAVFVALISICMLRDEKTYNRSKGIFIPLIIMIAVNFSMYSSNLILTKHFIGLVPLETSVQSIQSFKSCPYMINTGVMILCTILIKLLGCMVVFLIATLIITSQGKKRIFSVVVTALVMLIEIVAVFIPEAPVIFKEINVFSFFSFERFFIRYLNIDFFGMSVGRLPIFMCFALLILGLTWVTAIVGIKSRRARLIRESEQEYYNEINRRYIESRKIRHDIYNHFLAINALIETGNIEQAKHYIAEVSEQTDIAAMPVKTGRDVLDALLFKKTEQASELNITLSFEINCPFADCNVSDYDLCTIFGNILDNALEAVNAGDKISVVIEKQHDMLYISCENPFLCELKRRGDKIATTKKDVNAHGFGLLRVKEIAKRNSGDVKITAENNVFQIEILMNMNK